MTLPCLGLLEYAWEIPQLPGTWGSGTCPGHIKRELGGGQMTQSAGKPFGELNPSSKGRDYYTSRPKSGVHRPQHPELSQGERGCREELAIEQAGKTNPLIQLFSVSRVQSPS